MTLSNHSILQIVEAAKSQREFEIMYGSVSLSISIDIDTIW